MDYQNQPTEEKIAPEEQPVSEPQPVPKSSNAAVTPPPKPNNKNWKKWTLIGLVILFLTLVGGAFIFSQRQAKQPEPTTKQPIAKSSPTPDPTANWKTYKGKVFVFQYPSTWAVEEKIGWCEDDPACYIVNLENSERTVYIRVSSGHIPFSYATFDTNLKKTPLQITLDGKEYILEETYYDNKIKEANIVRTSHIITHEGKTYYLEFGTKLQGIKAVSDYYKAKDTGEIQKILRSFKFTK